MKHYNVTGMSCAACSQKVEKAVSKLSGVTECSVNLLTNSMTVEGSATEEEIAKAVENAGYGIKKEKSQKGRSENNDDKKEISSIYKRLIASIILTLILMYFSMGHTMWNWPIPSFMGNNPIAIGLIELLLSTLVMIINQKFFINGFKGIIHKSPNMDTLVALGSFASYAYSVCILFAMTNAELDMQMHYMHLQFYFESAAMILALITLGKLLEAKAKGRTTDALKNLLKLAPTKANIIRDGKEITVDISEVDVGTVFVVRPGESIPADGIVLEGESAVNESALTGESIPVDKEIGSKVSAATINQSGFLKCKATHVGKDTTLSKIIQMVTDASSTKAPIAKVADTVAGIFVPSVIAIATITIIGWLIAGKEFGFALSRGISVLVISCPCALGLATPVAIMVGSGMGAKNGILYKNAETLEKAGQTDIVVLDKTGTITEGRPVVTKVFATNGFDEGELIKLALSLEIKSEHPLAKAVVSYANSKNILPYELDSFTALPGNGLEGKLDNKDLKGGSYSYIKKISRLSVKEEELYAEIAAKGQTPLFFSIDGTLAGIICVADTIKSDSKKAIEELKAMGIKVHMLTGDNEKTARAIGKEAGVDNVIAGVLPDGKEQKVRELQRQGKVMMVGDGINDAPALTRADIGCAIGAGTDVAIDAASIVLMNSSLSDVPAAIRLSRQVLKNIHENLFWAFGYNIIGIPLAMGLFIPIFGWELNPMFGAAAMSISSFLVVSNALRLNLFDIRDKKHDRRRHHRSKENKTMTKEMKIEGMMCSHCEMSVKKALEAIDGVISADVSHEKGEAIVSLDKNVDSDVLKKAVEDKDYKVISVN